ncbi:hypothetical protein [Bacillus massiliigorillae]|uniref:hypothetical protein n=1 Tax=Bacillus massiliigorillae TaxID=1243664 RepID=UPI0005A8BCF6|nr:hypothetical protein [Bacillus massiliigorillae]
MPICPLCNGLQQVSLPCNKCQSVLIDKGKLTDYLDNYSAYEDIETLKQVDGVSDSIQRHQCVHFFFCENCGGEESVVIEE